MLDGARAHWLGAPKRVVHGATVIGGCYVTVADGTY